MSDTAGSGEPLSRVGEQSIPAIFEEAVAEYEDETAQLFKTDTFDRTLGDIQPLISAERHSGPYRGITYETMESIVRKLAYGFRDLGLDDSRVGIFSDTRMEWAQCDFALQAVESTVVTLFTDLSADLIEYQLTDSDCNAVIVENEELLDQLAQVEGEIDLDYIVTIDQIDGSYDTEAELLTLSDVYYRANQKYSQDDYREWVDRVDSEDVATIIYTSGTTGLPKGVCLTHDHIVSNIVQIRRIIHRKTVDDPTPGLPYLDSDDRTLSLLPLGHIYERTAGHYIMFDAGVTVGYAESTDTVDEDIKYVQPTKVSAVPLVFRRVYQSMRDEASGSRIKERIFGAAIGTARQWTRADDPGPWLRAKYSLFDRLVYSDIREELGGELDLVISGGASLGEDLGEVFNGLGFRLAEGYGATETSPVVAVNPPDGIKPGTVGLPVDGVDIRIDEDATELGEDDSNPVGELLVDGPNVFDEYLNKPEKTEEAFTDDGYFRTGDIFELREDGYLEFRDRTKNVLVLKTGETISPQQIENDFEESELVGQIMVIGQGEKFISALVVPDFEALKEEAEYWGFDVPDDPEEMLANRDIRRFIDDEIEEVNENLPDTHTVKEYRLVTKEWTPENGLLTPTMKPKRPVIKEEFSDEVDDIYR